MNKIGQSEGLLGRHLRTLLKNWIVLSKCAVCDSKKSKFTKEQEASGLSNSSGIKTPLSKISLPGHLLS